MNEFIKERFSYLADNKKENVPELNVSYGIDKNFLYGAGVSISSVLINNSDINFVFHVFTDYVDDDYLKSFNETAKQFNTSIIVYLIDPKYFADLPTSQFWSYATYFRVLSFEYLSESISTLLYLDADVVCKEVWNLSQKLYLKMSLLRLFLTMIVLRRHVQNVLTFRNEWTLFQCRRYLCQS